MEQVLSATQKRWVEQHAESGRLTGQFAVKLGVWLARQFEPDLKPHRFCPIRLDTPGLRLFLTFPTSGFGVVFVHSPILLATNIAGKCWWRKRGLARKAKTPSGFYLRCFPGEHL